MSKDDIVDHQFKDGHKKVGGKKKGYISHAKVLKRYLQSIDPGKELTKQEEIVLAMLKKALEGDVNAWKYICDRADGKPRETVDQNIIALNLYEAMTEDDIKKRIKEIETRQENTD